VGVPHIPALRGGQEYRSLDQVEVRSHRDGTVLATVSQVNAGVVRRDLRKAAQRAAVLRQFSTADLIARCKEAGRHFLEGTLPLNSEGDSQTPEQYVEALSATSGLPHNLCRRNMQKVFTVFDEMATILGGLTRGMDLEVVDGHFGAHGGIPVCYGPTTDALGVVLPSNSPGVNSIWIPALALRTPVMLKPGREEPWTPTRIIRAFLAAGLPGEAFGFYPTDHEGAGAILERCGRSMLFGDTAVTNAYAHNPAVQIHGPGRSKVLIGDDAIDDWREYLDVLASSIADNGGRSCINASAILVPRHAAEIADALAQKLAAIEPRPHDDDDARLSAFANPKFAQYIDQAILQGLGTPGAEDVTARYREGPRAVELDGGQYLRPTVVHCDSLDHPLANTEFLFPYCSVVEVPQAEMIEAMGYSLVVTAITRDAQWVDAMLGSAHVDRLNLGPVPTSHVEWDQPHEGNLFEFLYMRRALQRAESW